MAPPLAPPGFSRETTVAELACNASSTRPAAVLRKSRAARATNESVTAATTDDEDPQTALRKKKAWDLAYSGAKQIPMNLIMMYMSGNSLQIFSIFITVMMFWNPAKALIAMSASFRPLEAVPPQVDDTTASNATKSSATAAAASPSISLVPQKLVFVLLQIANMCLALYKCQKMGLLPTAESDWLAFHPLPGEITTASATGLIL